MVATRAKADPDGDGVTDGEDLGQPLALERPVGEHRRPPLRRQEMSPSPRIVPSMSFARFRFSSYWSRPGNQSYQPVT